MVIGIWVNTICLELGDFFQLKVDHTHPDLFGYPGSGRSAREGEEHKIIQPTMREDGEIKLRVM